MTLDKISRAILEMYGITKNDVISGKIKPSDLGTMIKTALMSLDSERQFSKLKEDRLKSGRDLEGLDDVEIIGRFYCPDALYDSQSKRDRKADRKTNLESFAEWTKENNLVLYKFRQFIPSTAKDSVYSPRTVDKARIIDLKLFGKTPRIMKLERAGGRNGDFHLQGLLALPEGEYPADGYERLDFSEMNKGIKDWIAYLNKPADARLERDMGTQFLIGHFDLAMLGLADWYTQTLKNRRNGVKQNPRTMWDG